MISSKDMRILEDKAKAAGITSLELMENAGRAVANELENNIGVKNKRILIVCYHGNNGGDGFVAARYLAEKAEVDILFLGDEEKLKHESQINYEKVRDDVLIQFVSLDFIDFEVYDIIVDAMLGTGSRPDMPYPFVEVIEAINQSKAFKLSVDIPTGTNPDTGEVSEKTVNADLVLTLHDIKTGLKTISDKVKVIDIGIPK